MSLSRQRTWLVIAALVIVQSPAMFAVKSGTASRKARVDRQIENDIALARTPLRGSVDIQPRAVCLHHCQRRERHLARIRRSGETRSFKLCQVQIADQAAQKHPEQYLFAGSERVVFDYGFPVLVDSVADPLELGFGDFCHVSDFEGWPPADAGGSDKISSYIR